MDGKPVFVTVIHRIHDPEGFQAAEAKALEAGLPSHVALPIHAATNDHGLGICIWEGESVDAVREVVEGAVGPWANNEGCGSARGTGGWSVHPGQMAVLPP